VLVGIFQCIVVGWIFGAKNLREYINSVSKRKIGAWWDYLIKFFIPSVLLVLIIVQFFTEMKGPYEGYPSWAIALGWIVIIIPLIVMIILALINNKPSESVTEEQSP
jgi:NSS family neurotransmitter:Na+ symporter